jgi:hypothetical protein
LDLKNFLLSGKILINKEDKKIEIKNENRSINYDIINSSDFGFIYEKFVGQILEDEGYSVQYNGLKKGLLDRGVDLIATKDEKMLFIQCKFINQTISKNKIDWILYKASNLLYEKYKNENKKLAFTLVVNNIDMNFSKKIPKNFKLNFTDIKKIKYPILQYFIDHNHIQNKVFLEVREIKMEI